MAEDLETRLSEAMWVPRDRRDVFARVLSGAGKESRGLFAFAFATLSVPALEFWQELNSRLFPKDPQRRFDEVLCRHGITIAGARTVRPAALSTAALAVLSATAEELPGRREAFLSLGAGISLANAHGIYVTATRKAQKASLPKSPPHLDGPVPELTVFETVEVAINLARLALGKKPNAEADALLALSKRQLDWQRGEQKGAEPAPAHAVPATSKPKGPGFALARAALMEARNVDHVSARGTSIKSAVMWGLELGESWWLEQLDEALMLADARSAFEKRKQRTSSPIVHVVWRGGDKTSRLWLVRLQSGTFALLAKLGRNWTTVEGDLSSVAATVPDTWFAKAMPVIEQRK